MCLRWIHPSYGYRCVARNLRVRTTCSIPDATEQFAAFLLALIGALLDGADLGLFIKSTAEGGRTWRAIDAFYGLPVVAARDCALVDTFFSCTVELAFAPRFSAFLLR